VCIHVALKRKIAHVGAAKVKEEHFWVLNKNETLLLLLSQQVIVNFFGANSSLAPDINC
jgi:hypothetical protein